MMDATLRWWGALFVSSFRQLFSSSALFVFSRTLQFSATKSCNSFDGISSAHTVIVFFIISCTRMIPYASSRCAPQAASIPARENQQSRHRADLTFQVRSIFQAPNPFLPQCELQSLFSCRRRRLRYQEGVRHTLTRAAPASHAFFGVQGLLPLFGDAVSGARFNKLLFVPGPLVRR